MLERYKDSLSDLVHLLKVVPKKQRNAERSRHCEGLLEEGKLPEFQVTMKLKDLEFYAFFMSPSIQRWESERNLIF